MKRKNVVVGIAALGLALVAAACGNASNTVAPTADTGPLTVWLMNGSAPDAVISALNTEFQAAHPGVTVNVELQQWGGISDKTNTALSTQSPPDVLEMGNTLVSGFASAGGLADLTSKQSSLGGGTWLQSLKEAGTLDGKLYGV